MLLSSFKASIALDIIVHELNPHKCSMKVVKRMWNYIRENDLQEPSNRRNINCDDTLRELFGVDKIDMFQMNKALAKHIWPLDSDGGMEMLLFILSFSFVFSFFPLVC